MASSDNLHPPLPTTTIGMTSISISQISIRLSKNDATQKRDSIRNTSIDSISYRAEKRKNLQNRLRLVSNVMCFLGLFGIILMIINNEISFTMADDDDTIVSWFIELTISISTLILIGLILYYYQLDLKLYCIKNSVEDWRIGLTGKKIFLIILEILICAIHPIPGHFYSNWTSNTTQINSSFSYISIDVALGIPMFVRLYLICRVIMFHSRLVNNASSQSLGYLNQVSMDFSFLIKTYLEQWPTCCLIISCMVIFFVGSWSLRACDYRSTGTHLSMLDSMWLCIVTFTTLGYGDITPSTYCGRSVAAIIILIGILCTALLISVVTQKLVLTRWEKHVHNFISNIELAKNRKHQAANVVKFSIKVWYLKRKYEHKSIQCIKAQWKLFQSIRIIKAVKVEQQQQIDSCVVLADLITLQRIENDRTENILQQIDTMKITIDKIEEKFIDIDQTMNNIQNILNVLLNRIRI